MKKITFEAGFVPMKYERRFFLAFIIWVAIFYVIFLTMHFEIGILLGIGYFVIFYFTRFRIKLRSKEK